MSTQGPPEHQPPPPQAGQPPQPTGPEGPLPQRPGQPPVPPPPPPAGTRRTLLVAATVVLALVTVVAGGLGAYAVFVKGAVPIPGFDPISSDPAKEWKSGPGAVMSGKLAWSDTYLENDPFDAHPTGYWLTGTLFIRGSHSRLVAYQRKTGQKVWQLDAPKNRKFCGMTTSTDGRTGAMALDVQTDQRSDLTKQPQRLCKDVQLVDLTTGKARWTTSFRPDTKDSEPTNAIVELAADVVIFHSSADSYGVAVSTGKKVWSTQAVKRGSERCEAQDIMPAPKRRTFVSLWRCGLGSRATLTTATVAPKTGKVDQLADLPKGSYDPTWSTAVGLASAEPAVVVVPGVEDRGEGRVMVLDLAGKPAVTIPQTGPYGVLDLVSMGQAGQPPVPSSPRPRYQLTVVGQTLYAVTTHKELAEVMKENAVVALDLASGKVRWTTKAGDAATVRLVGADEEGAVAISAGTYQHPPQPIRFAATDGARTELGPPYARDYIGAPIVSILIWADGQVILMPWRELPSVVGAPPPSSVFAFG